MLEQNPARSDIAMRFVVAFRYSVPEPAKFHAGMCPPIGVLRKWSRLLNPFPASSLVRHLFAPRFDDE